MRRTVLPAFLGVLIAGTSGFGWAVAADKAKPESPSPTLGAPPPSGAVVLFDGKDQNAWSSQMNRQWEETDGPADWKITPEGWLEVVPGAGSLISKQRWGDFQLHFEFRLPPGDVNGGVFLLARYELGISSSVQGGSRCGGFENLNQKLSPSERRPAIERMAIDGCRLPRSPLRCLGQGYTTSSGHGPIQRRYDSRPCRARCPQRSRQASRRRSGRANYASRTRCDPLVPQHLDRRPVRHCRLNSARHRMRRTNLVLVACCLSLATAQADEFQRNRLANWHQWRGPYADGSAPNADPPLHWDDATNVEWTADIPGSGSATPIVWGSRIFLLTAIDTKREPEVSPTTPAEPDKRPPVVSSGRRRGGRANKPIQTTPEPTSLYRFEILCLDLATGHIRWQRTATEEVPHEGHHFLHGYTSASPTTDGKRLYVSFGSQGIYCYDFDGNLLWSRNLGKMQTRREFGEGASP